MNSLNSVESPNTLSLKNPKRHTVDVVNFKNSMHEEKDGEHMNNSCSTNNSHLLVQRETILNGQTKTVEYLGGESSQNSSELPNQGMKPKFRKESLQVKIFKTPTVETCSPFLRKELEDYKHEKENENDKLEKQVVSPMIEIRENDEEEEKKAEPNNGNL